MLANLNGFDPAIHSVKPAEMLALDYWIVRRCQILQSEIIEHYHQYNFLNIYQKAHNFCVIELGGFYLDIIKDRQYTTQADSLARRSTQTAMFYIVGMLSRWIAPILSFTADEIWQNIPGEKTESVFLTDFEDVLAEFPESKVFPDEVWRKVMAVKSAVNKELESKRAEKIIGSGLSAEVDLFCESDLGDLLGKLGEELRFVLIVSRASIKTLGNTDFEAVGTEVDGLKLSVKPSDYNKCSRCWHHRADVGEAVSHPSLCQRCVGNIEGMGESRSFA